MPGNIKVVIKKFPGLMVAQEVYIDNLSFQ